MSEAADTQPKKWDYPRDTVVLRQFPRGPWAPNISPYCIKLETYLRMAGIPYVVDFKSGFSSKLKFPWMSYNGEDITDSQFCIEYLNDKLQIDLNKHLSSDQRAFAKAFQRLADEHLYWTHYFMCISHVEETRKIYGVFKSAFEEFLKDGKPRLWEQGMGRHSTKEVEHITKVDLKAISDYLGNKDYLTGSEPCEEDCALFGQLSQCLWHAEGLPHLKMINESFPNVRAYCMRMKDRFWPDWNQCITHGYTKKPVKRNGRIILTSKM